MPLILGAQSAVATGFSVPNSCQFITQDSPVLSLSQASGTSTKTLTVSMWFKRAGSGTSDYGTLWSTGTGTADGMQIAFYQDELVTESWDGSVNPKIQTNRVFRDPLAWYHLCMIWDTTESVAGDRMRLYINGAELTDFDADVNPSLNYDIPGWSGSGDTVSIGKEVLAGSWEYFDGYLAEVCCLDGQALGPTSFGEFNEDSPTIWQPIDVSGLTFGTNGFYLDFKDSANLGNDAAGSNDLTETNIAAVNQAQDSPANNFCTLSPLQPYGASVYLYDTATQFVGTQGNAWRIVTGSTAVTTGKYYYELKINTSSSNNSYSIGWTSTNNMPASIWTTYLGDAVVGPALGLAKDGQLNYSTSTAANQASTGYTAYTNSEIVMCAIDLDNNFAYWGREGTWMKSGDPESGATGTGGFAFDNAAGYDWLPALGSSETASGSTIHMSLNFGNGSFANVSGAPTAITSPGTNASGFGVFEFDVPDGYGAICTKQMNE